MKNQTGEDRDDPWTNPSWSSLLVVMPFLIASVALMWGAIANYSLAAREKAITGTITAHETDNHNVYVYTFAIEGKAYTGRQIPDRRDLAVGQQVLVYYDPRDPAKSSLIGFDEVALGILGPAGFAFWLSVAVIVFVVVQRRRNQKRALQSNSEGPAIPLTKKFRENSLTQHDKVM